MANILVDGEKVIAKLEGSLSVFVLSSNGTFDIARDNEILVVDDQRSPYRSSAQIGETAFVVEPSDLN